MIAQHLLLHKHRYDIVEEIYGHDSSSLIKYELHNCEPQLLQVLLTNICYELNQLESNLLHAQQMMKKLLVQKDVLSDSQLATWV